MYQVHYPFLSLFSFIFCNICTTGHPTSPLASYFSSSMSYKYYFLFFTLHLWPHLPICLLYLRFLFLQSNLDIPHIIFSSFFFFSFLCLCVCVSVHLSIHVCVWVCPDIPVWCIRTCACMWKRQKKVDQSIFMAASTQKLEHKAVQKPSKLYHQLESIPEFLTCFYNSSSISTCRFYSIINTTLQEPPPLLFLLLAFCFLHDVASLPPSTIDG